MPEDIHWKKYSSRFKTYPAQLQAEESLYRIIVCIPVFAEPDLSTTLDALWGCERPGVPVEIILLFNSNEGMTSAEEMVHNLSWHECLDWVRRHEEPDFQFKPILMDVLPDPKSGVGWARKLVLDEAARRLEQDGIMICLDADCTVEKNYLSAVYTYFQQHPLCEAASIYFEHILDSLDPSTRHAIVQYELHLRYLVHAMRWAGHPFAHQTVGSAMAVRRRAYLMQGGMNTRQAGEDFYFLQKFIEINSLHEVKQTTVFPSPRVSGRVPFGTGRAMKQLVSEPTAWMTTNMEVFHHIRPLFHALDDLRQASLLQEESEKEDIYELELGLSIPLLSFLRSIDFFTECRQIAKQTTSFQGFKKRFFRYFNSFRMIRYMHYMRDHHFPDTSISKAASDLARVSNLTLAGDETDEDYLMIFRSIDKA